VPILRFLLTLTPRTAESSGLTGSSGNFGGIIFNVVFRFLDTNHHEAYWIIRIISVASVLYVSWNLVPKVLSMGKPDLTLSSSTEKWVDSVGLVLVIFDF
jgi:hypothetical protein